MVIPSGITSSWTKNSLEEWFCARNYQLMDLDSDRKDQNSLMQNVLWTVTLPGLVASNDLFRECELFSKLKCKNICKIKNNPVPAPLQTSYLSSEIKINAKIL
jgi:hypothetical protein